MSVLINGMKMPKDCTECKIKGEGSDSLYTWSCPFTGFEYTRYDCVNDRLDDCPLIEVPTPHGKLIDKNELRRELFLNFNGERIPFYDCDNFPTTLTYRDLHSILSEQPTIIEAEGNIL